MKKFIYSALVAIVAVGAVQSVKATIYSGSGTAIPCSPGETVDCSTFYTTLPANTPVYLQNPQTNPGTPQAGELEDYSYDLND